MSIKIKLGRHIYTITVKDRFMDNGSVCMLQTQSQEKISWGHRPDPSVSKKLYKQLCKDHKKTHIEYSDDYGRVEYFSFDV